MADHGAEEKKEAKAAGGGGLASKLQRIFELANTSTILGVTGWEVYTTLIFKKRKVSEAQERARIKAIAEAPKPIPTPALIEFTQMTVNIAPTKSPAATGEGAEGSAKAKMHYLTLAFMMEIADDKLKVKVEELRPRIMDKMLAVLSRKAYLELSTVQGRWLLRSQFLEITNDLLKQDLQTNDSLAVNLYFTQFIVQ